LTADDARIVRLEEALAHAEASLQDVSDMVARQWDVVDRLTREMERLRARLAAMEEKAGEG
jgi:SlyX protein